MGKYPTEFKAKSVSFKAGGGVPPAPFSPSCLLPLEVTLIQKFGFSPIWSQSEMTSQSGVGLELEELRVKGRVNASKYI